ncbi:hypothetical protein [Streptomyces sp. Ac-502]|uniref:hypothetical protein n=1 Tax=Streptomyces sp. Ac-502 TaxID=3342801 RepID=UPI0038629279
MYSTDLYRDVTDFAHDTPGWVHSLAAGGTEGGILLLMALAVLGWWRSRKGRSGWSRSRSWYRSPRRSRIW